MGVGPSTADPVLHVGPPNPDNYSCGYYTSIACSKFCSNNEFTNISARDIANLYDFIQLKRPKKKLAASIKPLPPKILEEPFAAFNDYKTRMSDKEFSLFLDILRKNGPQFTTTSPIIANNMKQAFEDKLHVKNEEINKESSLPTLIPVSLAGVNIYIIIKP